MIRTVVDTLLLNNERNIFKREKSEKSVRVRKIGKFVDVGAFLKKCKANKCTFNVACISIIGQAMKEYDKRFGKDDLNQVQIASSFALRGFPNKVEDIVMGNDWVPLYYSIPVTSDIKKNCDYN
jgi:hypothetical protein